MVMIEIDSENSFSLDRKIQTELDIYAEACKQNDDLVFVIDGPEGAGKSVLARQLGFYLAKVLGTSFSVDNIHFNLNSYMDFSIKAPKNTVCILDETRSVLNKQSTMSKGNKRFTNYLSECRSKNQIHILVLPAFHDLDKYVTLWRMKFVVHVLKWWKKSNKFSSGYEIGRGAFTLFFNDDNLKFFYTNPYKYPKQWALKCSFPKTEVIDPDEYNKKKGGNIFEKYHSSKQDELSKMEKRWRHRWALLCQHLYTNDNWEIKDIAKVMGMNYNTTKAQIHEGLEVKA